MHSNQILRLFFAAIAPFMIPSATQSVISNTDVQDAAASGFEMPQTPEASLPQLFDQAAQITTIERPQIATVKVAAPARTSTSSSKPKSTSKPGCATYIRLDSNPRDLCIFTSTNTATDAGQKVAMYMDAHGRTSGIGSGSTFLYAHNYANIFGKLGNAKTFTITSNGVTRKYQVIKKTTYCYHDCNGQAISYGWMSDVINPNKFGATISLMTCSGKAWGPGDAKDRLVVYAREI